MRLTQIFMLFFRNCQRKGKFCLFVNYLNFICATSSCIMLVNLSAYVSQGVGRLRHHHETVLEHSWLRGRIHPDQTGPFLCSKQGTRGE